METDEDKARVIVDPKVVPGVKNYDVNHFFADAIYVKSNAIAVGTRFSLPDFDGVDAYMKEHYPGIVAHAAATH